MKKRVVVAMSGGVDSSVAAALLKEQGYEVVGITMRFGSATKAIEDAGKVARTLGIRHEVIDSQRQLEERVIRDLCREYARARTPNPCVRCNQYIKFGFLLGKALALKAAFLATGHYARITKSRGRANASARYALKKAGDLKKDQSYFLYRLSQRQLAHILFPLGGYTKQEVRRLAEKHRLPVAEKRASQEICFLHGSDYREFLRTRAGSRIKPGAIRDKDGFILGSHKGIAYYTIGQREGLGIARGYPLYVIRMDARRNEITVGRKEDAFSREFIVDHPHYTMGGVKREIAAKVRIRYNHKEAAADLIAQGGRVRVRFRLAQFAITAGQSAVFYDKDTVLGGGIISKVLD